MKFPRGFHTSRTDKVCLLKESTYSLYQAPQCWFSKLSTTLTQYDFKYFYADYSVFIYATNRIILCFLVYVDDIIIIGNDSQEIATFKSHLSTCFHMKDLGNLKYFLGIEGFWLVFKPAQVCFGH